MFDHPCSALGPEAISHVFWAPFFLHPPNLFLLTLPFFSTLKPCLGTVCRNLVCSTLRNPFFSTPYLAFFTLCLVFVHPPPCFFHPRACLFHIGRCAKIHLKTPNHSESKCCLSPLSPSKVAPGNTPPSGGACPSNDPNRKAFLGYSLGARHELAAACSFRRLFRGERRCSIYSFSSIIIPVAN